MRPPIDQTVGLVGAAIGLVLVGALVLLNGRVENHLTDVLGLPLNFLIYPVAALLGHDLATRGGPLAGAGALGHVGGYFTAAAVADLAVAAGVIAGVALDVPPSSGASYYNGVFVLSVGPALLGRMGGARLLLRHDARPAALIAGSVFAMFLALVGLSMAVVTYVVRVDS
jgi:hypothetical protein